MRSAGPAGADAATRTHVHEELFDTTPERLYALLHTPSAIRKWWGATRVIVVPEPGGLWSACWGEDEDAPDYVTWATVETFEPPRRMVLTEYEYRAAAKPIPFDAEFVTEFEVEPRGEAALLRVRQSGFPRTPAGDEFYAGCETGWRNTFAGIRDFLALDGGAEGGPTVDA